jgi:ABC-type sugar transport system ATPase subunit
MSLRAEGLVKRYGKQTILDDCSLTVNAGGCLLLRGPSGSGKSTLLRTLAFLENADSGAVVHGEQRWPAQELPADISPYPFLTVVFQQLFLWPNLTISQNVSLVLQQKLNVPMNDSATQIFDRFRIRGLIQRLPHECSLGERQRIALARAFLSKAQFLLLDEPSSALDSTNRETLVELLREAKLAHRGLLLITHDDTTFDSLADDCLVLENGHLSSK